MAKLLLLDGNSLVHRAYHAIPPLTTSKGEQVNAVYGFASTLFKVLAQEKPDYVAVSFDVGRTFRHEEFDRYKAQRPEMPEDLASQFARVRQVVEALNIAVFQAEGYEADDCIGTLAAQATKEGIQTLIVTGDSDALQLIDGSVEVMTPGRKYSEYVVYDQAAVRERYGLEPKQLIDFKGLKGDASDNVPGVAGIGEKTAARLLQQFGSVEGIYEHLDQVDAKTREKLEAGREALAFSKRLVTIVTDAPVKLDLAACHVSGYQRERAVELLRELEFSSLLGKLPSEQEAAAPQAALLAEAPGREAAVPAVPLQMELFAEPAPAAPPRSVATLPGPVGARPKSLVQYHVVDSWSELEGLVAKLAQARSFAVDVESTDRQAMLADLVGLAVAVDGNEAYYIPLRHRGTDQQLPAQPALSKLKPVLEEEKIPKYAHNGKYDMLVLAQDGVQLKGLAFDTMVAAYLLNEKALGLKDLAFTRLGVEMTPISALIGGGTRQLSMADVPVEAVAPYASADAAMTYRLKEYLEPRLQEQGLWQLFAEVEMPLVEALARMELDGVALDVEFLKQMSRELYQRLQLLENEIYRSVGHAFNVNSTQQLGAVLFDELRLPSAGKTKTGYATDMAVLESLRGVHPIIDLILEYRQLVKIKSTYADALPLLVNPRTGRVHTSYNQTVTSTGRLSSSDPNLQNIPIRTDIGKQVRRAFIASDGAPYLLAADYSQIELRILAHISQDSGLLSAFAAGEDIHAATASTVFGVAMDQVDPAKRRLAKTINFGVIYGITDYGLAQRTELSREDAARFIAAYFAKYPRVKEYVEHTKQEARERGYVSTLLGRRRYLPELKSPNRQLVAATEREAINMPIQGTAADIIKIAMVRLYREIQGRGLRSKMTLQVHDELLFEVPEDELGIMKELVKARMEEALELDAPLKADIKVGRNWGEL
ncbi:MAG: DNA polymerase I [Chloroflexota bacterium]